MTLTELADRIEHAGADEQRELLNQAFVLTHGPHEVAAMYWSDEAPKGSFRAKLDAEAYLDAAMMLVPEGWRISVGSITSPGFHAAVMEYETSREGFARSATPALALTAASLRARSEHDA